MAALLVSTVAYGRGCPVDAGFRGGGFHVGWEQRNLVNVSHGWKKLPAQARANLRAALQAHLGRDFARKLELDQIQSLDRPTLRQQFPEVFERNRDLGAYHLLFRFADRSRGLKYYYFDLFAHEGGTPTKRIPLPDIGSWPAKGRIVSCGEARQRARFHGIPTEFASVDFEFSPKYNCFVWKVLDTRAFDPGDVPKGVYRVLELEAHSGKVLAEHIELIVV